MQALNRKLYGEKKQNKNQPAPSIMRVIQAAINQQIPYGVMENINYTDLQALIIENNIVQFEIAIANKEKERLSARGVSRRRATAAEIDAFHQ